MTFLLLLAASCALSSIPALTQETAREVPPDQTATEEEKPLPGDWAVNLLDQISNYSTPEGRHALLRAVMATGPRLVPALEEALKDDRTAEFAAQALAYLGGDRAMKVLWEAVSDPRDLSLRRFYFGALGEFDVPEVKEALLAVVKQADAEPDWTVTQAAIFALTVHSDPQLVPKLREIESNIDDIVIRLDLENAIEVIERRSKYLSVPERKAGGSIEHAVRTYFAPALESAEPPLSQPPQAARSPSAKTTATKPLGRATRPQPTVDVRIEDVTVGPAGDRALARVIFEDPTAKATFDIVLQKKYGDWTVASVWLESEVDKSPSKPDYSEPVVE